MLSIGSPPARTPSLLRHVLSQMPSSHGLLKLLEALDALRHAARTAQQLTGIIGHALAKRDQESRSEDTASEFTSDQNND